MTHFRLTIARGKLAAALAIAVCLSACGTVKKATRKIADAVPDVPKIGKISKPQTIGTVEFRGFNADALDDFRVISTAGGDLSKPAGNTKISGVDGVWWRHQRGLWFKIPNHCNVVISAAEGAVIRSAFVTQSDCGKVGVGLKKLRKQTHDPRFVPDAGATAHATDYPFIDPPVAKPDASPAPLLP